MTKQKFSPVVTHVISGDLWAGAEVQVFNLCLALQQSGGANVTAVVFNTGVLYERLQTLGIPLTLADEKTVSPWGIAHAIARHCRSNGSDIVHTHGFKENVLGILGKEISGTRASVRTVHGNPEIKLSLTQPHKWLISKLDITMGRLLQQAVIAVSGQLEEKLRPIYPGKVFKISNFIDVANLRTTWGSGSQVKEPGLRFGIAGRLVPVKRVDLFIDTIALLNRRGLSCEGVILGDGPLEGALRSQASERGISEKITFRGFVNPVYPELKTLSALVMTSDHEGLPMTLLEALALEIPVVAHNVGGIPEVLSQGAGGSLVDDHSPEGYAKALQDLISSPQNISAKTHAGLATVLGHFDRFAQTDRYLEIYRSLV